MGLRSIEFWLWPNLLSLDAPAIAMLWQVSFARCLRVRVPVAATIALGTSVWVLYVADRILDGMAAPTLAPSPANDTPRHRFYRRNRDRTAPWAAEFAILVIWLALIYLPTALLRDYLALALGVAIYFGIVHAAPPKLRARLLKELAVAVFFAIGVCVPLRNSHGWPLFAAFAALLWINTLAIDCWEAPPPDWEPPFLVGICAALGLFCGVAASFGGIPQPRKIPVGCDRPLLRASGGARCLPPSPLPERTPRPGRHRPANSLVVAPLKPEVTTKG